MATGATLPVTPGRTAPKGGRCVRAKNAAGKTARTNKWVRAERELGRFNARTQRLGAASEG